MIEDSHRGDVLLIEKIDRLSRLPFEQWKELKQKLIEAGINIVVLDQPMTHAVLNHTDQQTSMISRVLSEFMIDLAAAMARDDDETRRKRGKTFCFYWQRARAGRKYKNYWDAVAQLLRQ